MTILKSSDGKVITNLAGEVLNTPDALIDIRSTFGITKDGSNVVQKIKYFNNPAKRFHSPVNAPCIVNVKDDGFNFTSNTNGYLQGESIIDLSADFFVGAWVKFQSNDLLTNKFIFGSYNTVAGITFHFLTSERMAMFSINGVEIVEVNVNYPSTLTIWNYYSVERTGSNVTFCRNGFVSYKTPSSQNYGTQKQKLQIGNTGGINNQPFDGKLDDLIIYNKNIYNSNSIALGSYSFTPPIRSSSL